METLKCQETLWKILAVFGEDMVKTKELLRLGSSSLIGHGSRWSGVDQFAFDWRLGVARNRRIVRRAIGVGGVLASGARLVDRTEFTEALRIHECLKHGDLIRRQYLDGCDAASDAASAAARATGGAGALLFGAPLLDGLTTDAPAGM